MAILRVRDEQGNVIDIPAIKGKDGKTPVKGVDYFDGSDGISPIITTSSITGGNRITITDANGTKFVDVMDGEKGDKGDTGKGISTVTRTSGNGAAGTTDTYTIKYTDNTTSTFTVYNGKDGTNGTSVAVSNVSESTASGGSNVVTFSDGKTLTVKNGTNGTNGVSPTHSWNGTTLTITSASGTSSADLKGAKGDTGKSYLSEFVTVKEYGAIGNGSTDDTTAINNALTAAGSSGRQVYFPAGTYKVTSSLKVPDGILLRGDCGKSVVKTYVTSGYVLEGTSSTDLASVSIVDLTFQNGNSADGTTKLQSGDFMYNATGFYMRNCRVKNYYRVFQHLSNNSYLYNNRFTAIYKHFVSTTTDSVVDGNYINSSRYGLAQKSKMYAGNFNSTSFQNNLVDYFYDIFPCITVMSGTISNNTFNRCVTAFHDTMCHYSVCNNIFTGFSPASVDMSVLTEAQQAELTAKKWSIIKFDNEAVSNANHVMGEVVFANNVGHDVDNYIYIADGIQVIPAECDFRGNMINASTQNKPSAVDVGFRNADATITAYNSFQNVYFDFLDMKEWTTLPSANLKGNTAKSVKSFPYMKAIYNNEIYININGAWRMYAPPIYNGGVS